MCGKVAHGDVNYNDDDDYDTDLCVGGHIMMIAMMMTIAMVMMIMTTITKAWEGIANHDFNENCNHDDNDCDDRYNISLTDAWEGVAHEDDDSFDYDDHNFDDDDDDKNYRCVGRRCTL